MANPEKKPALEFLGREPNNIGNYRCNACDAEFDFRATDWLDRHDYLEPKFCPVCGKSEVDA